MRTKGSCRFAAYYKVEHYDQRFCVWRVIQKAFDSITAAESFAIGAGYEKTRVIKITEKGIEIS